MQLCRGTRQFNAIGKGGRRAATADIGDDAEIVTAVKKTPEDVLRSAVESVTQVSTFFTLARKERRCKTIYSEILIFIQSVAIFKNIGMDHALVLRASIGVVKVLNS